VIETGTVPLRVALLVGAVIVTVQGNTWACAPLASSAAKSKDTTPSTRKNFLKTGREPTLGTVSVGGPPKLKGRRNTAQTQMLRCGAKSLYADANSEVNDHKYVQMVILCIRPFSRG
jgi:hypothetical protein